MSTVEAEKERADYAWKNVRTIEAAYQAERKKREAAEAMYAAQCQCTDEWVEKYRAEVERKADSTLLDRVAELEQSLAAMNSRLAQAQTPNVELTGADRRPG